MVVLPPGTVLQLMYLRERLSRLPAGRFIEIGPGSGEITGLLLQLGWSGKAYDLSPETIEGLRRRFADQIASGRLTVADQDYVTAADTGVDLVISCMVMEHLPDVQQSMFMQKSRAVIDPAGRMIGLVPASPRHWGIEDDIAGHCRRYTRPALAALAESCGWRVVHMAGLTFPVSNLLLPVSNFLVRRQEQRKLALDHMERTRQSGRRRVFLKTHFPSVLGLFLNRIFLFPLHLLQKLYATSESALVLYFEATPDASARAVDGKNSANCNDTAAVRAAETPLRRT